MEKIKGQASLSFSSRFSNTKLRNKYLDSVNSVTYDHRLRRTGHPVRSAIHKPQIGRLVVGWVTTSEYLLLIVLPFFPNLLALNCAICYGLIPASAALMFYHLSDTRYVLRCRDMIVRCASTKPRGSP